MNVIRSEREKVPGRTVRLAHLRFPAKDGAGRKPAFLDFEIAF